MRRPATEPPPEPPDCHTTRFRRRTDIDGDRRHVPTSLLAIAAAALLLPGLPAAAQSGQPRVESGAIVVAGDSGLVPDPPLGATALAQAMRIDERVRIDGVLDEPFWGTIEPITRFVQRDPVDGGVPSEPTEMRIAYDEANLYFGFSLLDSDPRSIRAAVLHRGGNIGFDDHIVIGLDTFNDRRNGYIFEINSFGTQDDALFTDETIQDWNWDGVYTSEGRITEEGWFLEVAIPFTTIRFPRAEALQMGLIVRRWIPRRNESIFWPQLPATYRGGYAQASQYGTLVGLEGVSPGRNLYLKPYLLGGQSTGSGIPTDRVLDAGLDVKYAVTPSLTLDLTYNTDFAQVEADNVQINLERFSLFFPEKREFFLERTGLFTFGDAGQTQLFFSRRIGLENPILGGGRLTGQLGRFTIGLLDLQTGREGELDGANNAVARIRADLGPRASVGGIVTNLDGSEGWSRSAGADAQVRFLGSSSFDVWVARIWDEALTPSGEGPGGPADGRAAGSVSLNVRNARYGVLGGYTNIGRDFLPALGFVRRPDQVRWNGELAFTPRFDRSPWARQLTLYARGNTIDGQDGRRQSGQQSLDGFLSLQTGDGLGGSVTRRFERLDAPFRIAGDATVAPGDYTFSSVSFNARTNGSRRFSANANVSLGEFYGGSRTQFGAGGAVTVSPHLSLATSISRNLLDLPVENGVFGTTVVELTVKAAASRNLFADALFQYDDVSSRLQGNLRINWIHRPGSNLYLVLNSGYFTGDLLDPATSRWEQQTGVVKLTYLWAL